MRSNTKQPASPIPTASSLTCTAPDLSPELIGKSVMVTDDGFLKRIRVAQFSNEVTRVVLDVSDVSDYSAFLLPNPYRLIIDIHGRKGAPANDVAQSAQPAPNPALSDAPPPLGNAAPITRTPTRRSSPDSNGSPAFEHCRRPPRLTRPPSRNTLRRKVRLFRTSPTSAISPTR